MAEIGVDAVLCQGGEGGGHTGTIPTSLLLPQVLDAVDVPVIASRRIPTTAGAWPRPWPGAPTASPWEPGSC